MTALRPRGRPLKYLSGTVESLWTLKPGNENWRAASRKNGALVLNVMLVIHPLKFELFECIAAQ